MCGRPGFRGSNVANPNTTQPVAETGLSPEHPPRSPIRVRPRRFPQPANTGPVPRLSRPRLIGNICLFEQGDCWGGAGCREGPGTGGRGGGDFFRFWCGDSQGASVNENRPTMWFRGCFPIRATRAGRVSFAKPVSLQRNATATGGKTGQQPSPGAEKWGSPVRHENCGSKIPPAQFLDRRSTCTLPVVLCCFSFPGAVP